MTSIEDDRKHLGPDGVSARKPAAPAPASADLDALEQAARAATPGPWRVQGGPSEGVDYILAGREDFLTGPLRRPNAAFIAAASPDVILRLIAAVREADALREALQGVVDHARPFDETGHSLTDKCWPNAHATLRAALSATEPAE